MKKVLSTLKRVATALPYLTFLTVFLYLAGRQFDTKYWQAIGLPLMATDKQFADMLYDGFLGYILWAGSVLGSKFDPTVSILILSIAVVTLYRLAQWGGDNVLKMIEKRRLGSSREPLSPRVRAFLNELEKSGGYFVIVSLPLLSIPILVGMTALTPALPTLALGKQGFVQGKKDMALYESRLRQLRDGLVDVSVVAIERADGDKLTRVIPMECAGDRCAAMTSDGPVSVPKDRVGEESVVFAVVTDACFSQAGLERRRTEAPFHH